MEMPKFRDITKAELEEINDLFTSYLFYHTLPSGDKHYECSHCNSDFALGFKRTFTFEDYELYTSQHNDRAKCPKCGEMCIVKNSGRAKTCKNLYEEQRVVVIHRINENYIQAVGRIAVKQYTEYCHRPRIQLLGYNQSNYIFRPGKVAQYRREHSYYDFHEIKIASEPFTPKTSWWNWGAVCDNSYMVIGLNKLKDSFLKYNRLGEYIDHYTEKRQKRGCTVIEIPIMRYLCRFCEYPQIEVLQKLGFWEYIENLVEKGLKSFPYVNWEAKELCGFFKMNKQDFKLFRENGGEFDLLKIKSDIKKITGECDIAKALKYYKLLPDQREYYYFGHVKEQYPEWDIYRKLKYIKKQADKSGRSLDSSKTLFFDYLDMAKKLKYDLKSEVVIFPRDLVQAHDTATEVYNAYLAEKNAKENAEKEKAAKKFINKYKKLYCFNDGEFLITVPTTTAEIIKEGKEQHHCVGAYAARHLEGKLAICFLRMVAEPDKALYTIEMHDTTVRQIQGYANSTPLTPEAESFFEKWKVWVKNGSHRDRKGNPKIVTV